MSQLELFPAPGWPEARCGTCVNRNGPETKPLADCTFEGMRHTNEADCGRWFSKAQVDEWFVKFFAARAGRPSTRSG